MNKIVNDQTSQKSNSLSSFDDANNSEDQGPLITYPKLKKKECLKRDPLKLHQSQIQDLRLRLDPGAQDRLRLKLNQNSPNTRQAMETLQITEKDLEIRKKNEFKLPGDSKEDMEIRYKIYLTQKSNIIKKIIIERNSLKKYEQFILKQKSKLYPPPTDQSQYSLQSYNLTSNGSVYKSPTEMIENWLEEKQEAANKRESKIESLKKKQIYDNYSQFDIFQQKKNEFEELKSKKEKNIQKFLSIKLFKAQKENELIQELLTKKKKQEEQNLAEQMRKKEMFEKNDQILERQLSNLSQMKSDKVYEQKLKNKSKIQQILTKKNSLIFSKSESDLLSVKIDKQLEQSHQRRQSNLKQIIEKMKTDEKINLVQQYKIIQDQEKKNENIFGVLNKFNKAQQFQSKSQINLMQILKDKQERESERISQIRNRIDQIQKQEQEKSNYLSERFSQKEQYINDRYQEKLTMVIEKSEKSKFSIEKNRNNYNKKQVAQSEKLNRMLEKQQDKYKINQEAYLKRKKLVQNMMIQRVQSQQNIDKFEDDLYLRKIQSKSKQKLKTSPNIKKTETLDSN